MKITNLWKDGIKSGETAHELDENDEASRSVISSKVKHKVRSFALVQK